MTSFVSRAALSVSVFIALAAGCASGNAREPQTIDPIEKVFQAKAPGLQITRTPEGRIAVQLVQGPSSFYGSNAPLYVLDDMPFQPGPGGVLIGINPHDIESIKVLRNPADTGIYGIRGGNGVIVITMKKAAKSSG